MGEGGAAALADGAEDVDLALVLADLAGGGLGAAVGGAGLGLRRGGVGIDGVAHGLAVDGDGVVDVAAGGVEAPRKRAGSTKVSSSTSGWPKRAGQSAASRRSHSASTREPRFGARRPGRIRKRLLLASRCWRSYCVRKSQPIQRSRAPHFGAGAEKPISATHAPRQRAAYHSVSPIFGSAPR